MTNRTIFFLLILLACKRPKPEGELILDFDNQFIITKSDSYRIQFVSITNDFGDELLTLKLKDEEVGSYKIFLFKPPAKYLQHGNINMIREDSLEKYIVVALESSDKKKVIEYEYPFNLKDTGQAVIEPIKGPFP